MKLTQALQNIVDAKIVVVDVGEYMLIVRAVDDGYDFLNDDGEWSMSPFALERLIVGVPRDLDLTTAEEVTR